MKHSSRSTTHIRVIDEIPDALYERLDSGKTMQFRALQPKASPKTEGEKPDLEKIACAEGLNPSYDLLEVSSGEKKHHDTKIQTLMLNDDLDRRLRNLYERHYRLNLREYDINVLYAAFGFVEWYERNESKKFYAPLLLMQLNMDRRGYKNRDFNITSDGDPAIPNTTFSKKMETEYGVSLPEFKDDDMPESYFKKVQDILPEGFKVMRWVTIGIFPFHKIFMYRDLDPKNWPSNSLINHEIIARLLGGKESSGDSFHAKAPDIDKLTLDKKVPSIILDADSSQHSAIVDALSGKSFVIQGPPGTGKSQTIVNIIAACVAEGKSVLFAAQKKAALDVVAKRLRERDLGLLLFEPGIKKASVYENLKEASKNRKQDWGEQNEQLIKKIKSAHEEFLRRSNEINRYKDFLFKQSSLWGLTSEGLIWRYVRAHNQKKDDNLYKWSGDIPPEEKFDEDLKFVEDYCDSLEKVKHYPHPLGELRNVLPDHPNIYKLKHEVGNVIRQIEKLPDRYKEFLIKYFRFAAGIFSFFLMIFSYGNYRSACKTLREFNKEYNPKLSFWSDLENKLDKINSLTVEEAIDIIKRYKLERDFHGKGENVRRFLKEQRGKEKNAKANLEYSVVSQEARKLMQDVDIGNIKKSTDAFRKIDKEILNLEKECVLRMGLSKDIPAGVGEGSAKKRTDLHLIRHEIGKKRQVPLRDLIHRAKDALLAMKPVWLMSPIGVSQLLPQSANLFDVLIIDEASQMLQEDSLPAIVRAKQIIIVGDKEQLPPSKYFMTQNEPDEDDKDRDDPDKSILDLAEERWGSKHMLRWHYRSRHHSLIDFSNKNFYDNRLEVLPSPAESDKKGELGVKRIYVDDASYKTGEATNMKEAERVLEEAKRCMEENLDLSIGIVTSNIKQRDLIQDEFDRMAAHDSTIQSYLQRWGDTVEEFIIKNLENMQGDERDIIIISTVYGLDSDSEKKTVAQRFGPINKDTGHRRLNVLFTRAKRRLLLVTSLKPNDIKTPEKSHRGVNILKNYLEYAATGRLEVGRGEGEPDSDFEIAVGEVLEGWGYKPTYQVGVSGYRIDIGVKHEDYKYGYLAGIECDGRAYHSSRSARDRDRLRQEQLEALSMDDSSNWVDRSQQIAMRTQIGKRG